MNGKELVEAGKKLLGVAYEQLDCQAFVEQSMAACGVHRDWKGSNAMYRDVRGVCPVEFAKDIYGGIPAGAALFIWANDGGEVQRGYTDGLGNASHVGLATGSPGDKGAIHSSQSKGKVCYSAFSNKPISGGWNYVGFFREVNYGRMIEDILSEAEHEEDVMMDAVVVAQSGKTVNFRELPKMTARVLDQIPVGTTVEVLREAGEEWYLISYKNREGYMMRKFLELIPDDNEPVDDEPNGQDDRLEDLERRVKRIEDTIGDKLGWG